MTLIGNKNGPGKGNNNAAYTSIASTSSSDFFETPGSIQHKIEKIGMGRYQWRLFFLAGLGWFLDNMWFQCIVVILDDIQHYFNMPDQYAGLPISINLIGMLLGATIWGILSDIYGRKITFIFPVILVSILGLFMSFIASSSLTAYCFVCFCMFLNGFLIGGSVNNDGILFFEVLPNGFEYVQLILSLFWGFGQLSIAIVGLLVYQDPRYGQGKNATHEGWKIVMRWFTFLTMLILLFRVIYRKVVFESIGYLLATGKYREADHIVMKIAEINGYDLELLTDTHDSTFSVENEENLEDDFNSVEEETVDIGEGKTCSSDPPTVETSINGGELNGWQKFIRLVNSDLRRLTISSWGTWAFISFGYTIFNGFLPKFLANEDQAQGFFEFFVFSVANIPGALFAAYLLRNKSSKGYKLTLQWTTLLSAVFTFLFGCRILMDALVLPTACLLAIVQSIMWAALFTYTPLLIRAELRGTLMGTSSSFSRIFGFLGPICVGTLLSFHLSMETCILVSSFSLLVAFFFSCFMH